MCESLRDGLIINVMRARKQGRKLNRSVHMGIRLGFIPSLGDETRPHQNFY